MVSEIFVLSLTNFKNFSPVSEVIKKRKEKQKACDVYDLAELKLK